MDGGKEKVEKVYYCIHCQKRPEEKPEIEIWMRNHGDCVIRVALPVLEDILREIANMGVTRKSK